MPGASSPAHRSSAVRIIAGLTQADTGNWLDGVHDPHFALRDGEKVRTWPSATSD